MNVNVAHDHPMTQEAERRRRQPEGKDLRCNHLQSEMILVEGMSTDELSPLWITLGLALGVAVLLVIVYIVKRNGKPKAPAAPVPLVDPTTPPSTTSYCYRSRHGRM